MNNFDIYNEILILKSLDHDDTFDNKINMNKKAFINLMKFLYYYEEEEEILFALNKINRFLEKRLYDLNLYFTFIIYDNMNIIDLLIIKYKFFINTETKYLFWKIILIFFSSQKVLHYSWDFQKKFTEISSLILKESNFSSFILIFEDLYSLILDKKLVYHFNINIEILIEIIIKIKIKKENKNLIIIINKIIWKVLYISPKNSLYLDYINNNITKIYVLDYYWLNNKECKILQNINISEESLLNILEYFEEDTLNNIKEKSNIIYYLIKKNLSVKETLKSKTDEAILLSKYIKNKYKQLNYFISDDFISNYLLDLERNFKKNNLSTLNNLLLLSNDNIQFKDSIFSHISFQNIISKYLLNFNVNDDIDLINIIKLIFNKKILISFTNYNIFWKIKRDNYKDEYIYFLINNKDYNDISDKKIKKIIYYWFNFIKESSDSNINYNTITLLIFKFMNHFIYQCNYPLIYKLMKFLNIIHKKLKNKSKFINELNFDKLKFLKIIHNINYNEFHEYLKIVINFYEIFNDLIIKNIEILYKINKNFIFNNEIYIYDNILIFYDKFYFYNKNYIIEEYNKFLNNYHIFFVKKDEFQLFINLFLITFNEKIWDEIIKKINYKLLYEFINFILKKYDKKNINSYIMNFVENFENIFNLLFNLLHNKYCQGKSIYNKILILIKYFFIFKEKFFNNNIIFENLNIIMDKLIGKKYEVIIKSNKKNLKLLYYIFMNELNWRDFDIKLIDKLYYLFLKKYNFVYDIKNIYYQYLDYYNMYIILYKNEICIIDIFNKFKKELNYNLFKKLFCFFDFNSLVRLLNYIWKNNFKIKVAKTDFNWLVLYKNNLNQEIKLYYINKIFIILFFNKDCIPKFINKINFDWILNNEILVIKILKIYRFLFYQGGNLLINSKKNIEDLNKILNHYKNNEIIQKDCCFILNIIDEKIDLLGDFKEIILNFYSNNFNNITNNSLIKYLKLNNLNIYEFLNLNNWINNVYNNETISQNLVTQLYITFLKIINNINDFNNINVNTIYKGDVLKNISTDNLKENIYNNFIKNIFTQDNFYIEINVKNDENFKKIINNLIILYSNKFITTDSLILIFEKILSIKIEIWSLKSLGMIYYIFQINIISNNMLNIDKLKNIYDTIKFDYNFDNENELNSEDNEYYYFIGVLIIFDHEIKNPKNILNKYLKILKFENNFFYYFNFLIFLSKYFTIIEKSQIMIIKKLLIEFFIKNLDFIFSKKDILQRLINTFNQLNTYQNVINLKIVDFDIVIDMDCNFEKDLTLDNNNLGKLVFFGDNMGLEHIAKKIILITNFMESIYCKSFYNKYEIIINEIFNILKLIKEKEIKDIELFNELLLSFYYILDIFYKTNKIEILFNNSNIKENLSIIFNSYLALDNDLYDYFKTIMILFINNVQFFLFLMKEEFDIFFDKIIVLFLTLKDYNFNKNKLIIVYFLKIICFTLQHNLFKNLFLKYHTKIQQKIFNLIEYLNIKDFNKQEVLILEYMLYYFLKLLTCDLFIIEVNFIDCVEIKKILEIIINRIFIDNENNEKDMISNIFQNNIFLNLIIKILVILPIYQFEKNKIDNEFINKILNILNIIKYKFNKNINIDKLKSKKVSIVESLINKYKNSVSTVNDLNYDNININNIFYLLKINNKIIDKISNNTTFDKKYILYFLKKLNNDKYELKYFKIYWFNNQVFESIYMILKFFDDEEIIKSALKKLNSMINNKEIILDYEYLNKINELMILFKDNKEYNLVLLNIILIITEYKEISNFESSYRKFIKNFTWELNKKIDNFKFEEVIDLININILWYNNNTVKIFQFIKIIKIFLSSKQIFKNKETFNKVIESFQFLIDIDLFPNYKESFILIFENIKANNYYNSIDCNNLIDFVLKNLEYLSNTELIEYDINYFFIDFLNKNSKDEYVNRTLLDFFINRKLEHVSNVNIIKLFRNIILNFLYKFEVNELFNFCEIFILKLDDKLISNSNFLNHINKYLKFKLKDNESLYYINIIRIIKLIKTKESFENYQNILLKNIYLDFLFHIENYLLNSLNNDFYSEIITFFFILINNNQQEILKDKLYWLFNIFILFNNNLLNKNNSENKDIIKIYYSYFKELYKLWINKENSHILIIYLLKIHSFEYITDILKIILKIKLDDVNKHKENLVEYLLLIWNIDLNFKSYQKEDLIIKINKISLIYFNYNDDNTNLKIKFLCFFIENFKFKKEINEIFFYYFYDSIFEDLEIILKKDDNFEINLVYNSLILINNMWSLENIERENLELYYFNKIIKFLFKFDTNLNIINELISMINIFISYNSNMKNIISKDINILKHIIKILEKFTNQNSFVVSKNIINNLFESEIENIDKNLSFKIDPKSLVYYKDNYKEIFSNIYFIKVFDQENNYFINFKMYYDLWENNIWFIKHGGKNVKFYKNFRIYKQNLLEIYDKQFIFEIPNRKDIFKLYEENLKTNCILIIKNKLFYDKNKFLIIKMENDYQQILWFNLLNNIKLY